MHVAPHTLFRDAASLTEAYAAVDWAAGPLGPVEGWSQSLRTAVSICLASRFPILLWWGPEMTLLYNEAYRPLIGEKHPAALGARGQDVFPEIWETTLAPMLGAVRASGEATYSEDQLMVLERHGFPEECYFTYSVSSTPDDDGGVGGIFTAALETTPRVVDRRRLDLLRRLGALADTLDLEEVSSKVLQELRADPADLAEVDLLLPGDDGPLVAVEPAGALAVTAAATVDGAPEPDEVMHLPVSLADGRAGLLAVRLSDQLVTDEPYVAFLTSVARAVSAALAPAAAYLAESRRADAQAHLAHRLEGLVQVAQLLGAAQTEEEVLAAITGRAVKVMSAVGAVLALRHGPVHVRSLTTDFCGDDVAADIALLLLNTPLPLAHAVRTGATSFFPDRASALRLFPLAEDVYARAGTEAAAYLPLRAAGEVFGVLVLAWDVARPFTADDQDLATALATLCAQTLDRVRARAAEQAAAGAVARMSETLQRSLLTTPPQPPGLEVAVRYQPAGEQAQVGGDWYDAFATPDGATALVIGDVTGHDRDAAAAMGQVRNLLRATAYGGPRSPAAVLGALERTMAGLEVRTLATSVLARLDPEPGGDGRVLRWSNAGHLPPALHTPGGGVRLLEAGDPDLLLGLDVDAHRTDSEVAVPEGATLLLYTDGLVERRGEGLEVGLGRLRAALDDLGALPLEHLCDALLERLVGPADATGGAGGDDVALLAVRVAPEHHLELPGEPASVPRARRHVVAACTAAGRPDLADTAALLTSEVVTNAVRHGTGPVHLAVTPVPGGLRLAVADDAPALPRQRAAQDDDEGGRGLALVEALAHRWGVGPGPAGRGKVVWFEVRAPA